MEWMIVGAFVAAVFILILVQLSIHSYRKLFNSNTARGTENKSKQISQNKEVQGKRIRKSVCEVNINTEAANKYSVVQSEQGDVNRPCSVKQTGQNQAYKHIHVSEQQVNTSSTRETTIKSRESIISRGNIQTKKQPPKSIGIASQKVEEDCYNATDNADPDRTNPTNNENPLNEEECSTRRQRTLMKRSSLNETERLQATTTDSTQQPPDQTENGIVESSDEDSDDDDEEIPEVIEGAEVDDDDDADSDSELVPCIGGFRLSMSESDVTYEDDWEPPDDSDIEIRNPDY